MTKNRIKKLLEADERNFRNLKQEVMALNWVNTLKEAERKEIKEKAMKNGVEYFILTLIKGEEHSIPKFVFDYLSYQRMKSNSFEERVYEDEKVKITFSIKLQFIIENKKTNEKCKIDKLTLYKMKYVIFYGGKNVKETKETK